MRFEILKDYHHALMDGPWFVGDQYLQVQPWEADFHPHIAKISTTAVWIRLEQLPIEYYHPEFLKHMGNKLGKLLKVDVITSAAIRGRYARLCIQINTANPLPKRVKIGPFWQDIVYENLPMLCYRCGRLGHRELHCSEVADELKTMPQHAPETRGEQGPLESDHAHTPWKTVQTRRARPRGSNAENPPRGKLLQRDTQTPINQRVHAASPKSHVMSTPQAEVVIGQENDGSSRPAGIHLDEVTLHVENQFLQQPRDMEMEGMQVPCMDNCPSTDQLSQNSKGKKTLELKRDVLHTMPTQTTLPLKNESPIGSKIFDPHSDTPRPSVYTHSPKQRASPHNSLHASTFNYPRRPSSGDGAPRTDMEWPLLRPIQRRDGELCQYTGSPTGSNGVEPGDTNSKSANEARTTTSAPSLYYKKFSL